MSFLVIPNEVYANQATIWAAAINDNLDPAATVLEYGSNQLPLNSGWNDFTTVDGKNRIRYQRVTLTGLKEGTRHDMALRVGGQIAADGSFTTIPYRLPNAGERPFTILLGSCFYRREDRHGSVGQTYMQMPSAARPDIKFLCGDQVYLDNPPQDFVNFHGSEWLQNRSFRTYVDTWTQITAAGGFGQLLKHGANFFSSDDHEYWNNAPDRGLNVPIFTVTQGRRDSWWGIARDLYKIFQTSPGAPVRFKIAPLSFCIAETRFNRGPHSGGSGDLMPQAYMDEIGSWTASLDGPGVLVLGQPFFAGAGDFKDYSMANYSRQYAQLTNHLRNSQHTIVILTGDVHFGRISVANLRPELGTKLYEVISSPMQLVPLGGGDYSAAPQVFGSVSSEPEFSRKRNHFLTLEFHAPSAQRASMQVKLWPITQNGITQPFETVGPPIELI